jgi:hypothetical protein
MLSGSNGVAFMVDNGQADSEHLQKRFRPGGFPDD